MPNQFKCRQCGAINTVTITKPGENTICKNCGVFNNVPEFGDDPDNIPTGGIPDDPRLHQVAAPPEKRVSLGNWGIMEMFGENFRVCFKHFFTIVLIYAVVQLPTEAFNYFIESLLGVGSGFDTAVALMGIIGSLLGVIFTIIFTPLAIAAISYLVYKDYIGEKTGLFDSYRVVFSRAKELIPTYILVGIAILLMAVTIIGIPVAIYFSIMWTAVISVALLERYQISGNIDRSKKLADGNFWNIFGLYFLVLLVLMIPIMGSIFVFVPLFMSYGRIASMVVMSFLILLISALTLPLPAIIYLGLRAKKENYDFDMLRQDVRLLEREAGIETKST